MDHSKTLAVISMLVLHLVWSGCKKEYVEIVPVLEMQLLSLPFEGVPRHHQFLSENIGFVAPLTGNTLYRTTNGGTTWEPITAGNSNIIRICFISAESGWVSTTNALLRTHDGGETWTDAGTASFIGRTDGGLIIRTNYNSGPNTISLRVSQDGGETFPTVGTVYPWLGNFRISAEEILMWGFQSGTFTGRRIDPLTGLSSNILGYSPEVYQGTKDMYFEGSCGTIVGEGGEIKEACSGNTFLRKNPWNRHIYHAVDGHTGGPRFAVGDNTISTSYDTGTNSWSEVMTTNGKNIPGAFRSIDVISPTFMVIGDDAGHLFKCRF